MNNNRKRRTEIEYEMGSIDNSSTIKHHRVYNDDGTFETIISEVIVEKKRLSRKEKREAYLNQLMEIEQKTDDYIFQYGREQKFKCQLFPCHHSDVKYKGDEALEKHLKETHEARMTVEKYVDTMLSKLMGMSNEK
jgi:hypothetical protein